MSLKLYYAPGACSFVPHCLLEASGAVFEPVMVKLHKGEQHSPEYQAINPRGQVPVLVDGAHVVTLSGTVPSETERLSAESIARSVAEVRDVKNELAVKS